MKTRTELLNVAKAQLKKDGTKFRAYVGLGGGQPWCDAFAYWLYNANGCGTLLPWKGRQRTYCPDSIKWCRANLAQIPPYLALPCDIIYFDWERNGIPNHVGIVHSRISTSKIKTLEGNTSGGIVDIKGRNAYYVQGIFRTHFPSSKPLKKCKLDEKNTEFGYLTIYNLQLALGMKGNGILTKETVKFLQKRAKTTQDGVWSVGTSKAIQRMIGATPDGEFGAKSVILLKKWINRVNYPVTAKKPAKAKPAPQKTTSKPKTTTKPKPVAKPKTTAKPKPVAKPKAPAKKGYAGTFPTLNNNRKIINSMAYRMCYPYGTPQKTYKFEGGKPKPAYKAGIDKIFPKHKTWSNKRQRVGACCDVFVAVCLGYAGIKAKKDLKNQLVEFPKYKSLKSNGHHKASEFRLGDVVQRGRKDRSGHTWVVCELINGKRYIANSHYKKLHGCYAVMDAKPKDIDHKKWKYYKCYTPQGAVRTWYGIGDYGYDVLYIQKFLKWAGFFKGSCNGDYNKVTAQAVVKFQKSLGWKGDPHGRCGKATIMAMRGVKR